MYDVHFSDVALKKLKKMDRYQSSLLIGWIEKNLQGSSDPRTFGKALVANHKGKWRYRVGDYRILALIEDEKIIITIIDIGHRKDIYG
ncbi:type II toxin-antitoxin system RelE family toxin [Indiicoccus explosivorum]|uniref:type II toxin-antitoxin system RelE family toxin n=1 Tax=Indiicoccus explosivorum TaxID=1917864 RepID=UPI000B43279B|nr:type II toxin-antitoxin system RelE/ParE family toxin [Indiicoccus explosivorum]